MSEINLIKASAHEVPREVARSLATCSAAVIRASEVVVGVEIAGAPVLNAYGYRLLGNESEESLSLNMDGAERFYRFYEGNFAVDPQTAPESDCGVFAMAVKDYGSLTWDNLKNGAATLQRTYSGDLKEGGHYLFLNAEYEVLHHMLALKGGERTVSKLGDNGCLAIARLAITHALYYSAEPLEPGTVAYGLIPSQI